MNERSTFMYCDGEGKWVENSHPKIQTIKTGEVFIQTIRKGFRDVVFSSINMIFYFSFIPVFSAFVLLILNASGEKQDQKEYINFLIASLLISTNFINLVAKFLSKVLNQFSLFSGGLSWLLEITVQNTLVIWVLFSRTNFYFKIIMVFFSAVQLTTGLFEFASASNSIFPKPAKNSFHYYDGIHAWIAPKNFYSVFGALCWFSNTLIPIGVCLNLDIKYLIAFVPFMLLNFYNLFSRLILIVKNFKETSVKPHQQGIEYMRDCTEEEKAILKKGFDICLEIEEAKKQTKEEKPNNTRIRWINLFVNGKFDQLFSKHDEFKQKFISMIQQHLKEFYPGENPSVLSFGYVTNPKNSIYDQNWHIDYDDEVSNIFIPIDNVTERNATQFLQGPVKSPFPESGCFPKLIDFYDFEKAKYLKLSQIICKAFSILKLFPGVCHRGIANGEDYDRVVFWITTCPRDLNLNNEESGIVEIEDIDNDVLLENLKKGQ